MLAQSVWNNARRVTAYLLYKLETGEDARPWAPRDTDTLEESIRQYRLAVDFTEDLVDALSYSFVLAGSLQDRLVEAQRAASLIQVKGVSNAVAKTLASDLDLIGQALRRDQRFTAVAQVAGALVLALIGLVDRRDGGETAIEPRYDWHASGDKREAGFKAAHTDLNQRLARALFDADSVINTVSWLLRTESSAHIPGAASLRPSAVEQVIHGVGQGWGESGEEELVFLTSHPSEMLVLERLFAEVDADMKAVSCRVIRTGLLMACAVKGGDSIRLVPGTMGTLGAEVKNAAGTKYLLSCNHVIADMNAGICGVSEIWHPGTTGGSRLGLLHDFAPLHFGTSTPNRIDAALGLPDSSGSLSPGLRKLGSIHGVNASPAPNLDVSKVGASTGRTDGKLAMWNLSFISIFPDGSSGLFEQQYGILGTGPGYFAQRGDSGAVVVDGSGAAVALLIATASGTDLTFATPIQEVLDHFSVTFS